MYVSRGSPSLNLAEITEYVPRNPGVGNGTGSQEQGAKGGNGNRSAWDAIFARMFAHPDDGHAAKLVRAIAFGESVCRPHETEAEGERGQEKEDMKIHGPMWLQIGNMVADSVEDGQDTWVRNAGFEKAWEGFRDRARI